MKNIIVYMLLVGLFLFNPSLGHTQQISKSEGGSFLLKNATIVTVTNGTMKGDVLISDGKIAEVGKSLSANGAKTIDCTDKFVYPGMIDAGTTLGLSEVGAVSLTNDHNEIGDFIPHMKALTAVNPNGVAIPVTRVSGVTTVLTMPTGGTFSGTASLINLHGYTPEQMHAGFDAVVMNFPSTGRRGWWDRRTDEEMKKEQEKAEKKLKDIMKQSMLYAKIDSSTRANKSAPKGYNPGLEVMKGVVRGTTTLLINVNKKADILAALEWVKKNKVKAVLMGVAEGWRVADKIKEAGLPVIVGPVLSTPSRSSDGYDAPYKNAGRLAAAGIKVAIRTSDSENVRNLPYNAGFAAAYGMGIEEALKAITINTAEIFGVADKYGSIEKGKVANIFVSDGDPFETSTDIHHLFIEGWKVPIESRHTHLYNEFLERSPGLNRD